MVLLVPPSLVVSKLPVPGLKALLAEDRLGQVNQGSRRAFAASAWDNEGHLSLGSIWEQGGLLVWGTSDRLIPDNTSGVPQSLAGGT